MNQKKQTFGELLRDFQESHFEKTVLPQNYLLGFYFTQVFEFGLEMLLRQYTDSTKAALKKYNITYNFEFKDNWTYIDYKNRLLNFIPKNENEKFYKALEKANNSRNKFIHKSFRNLNLNNIHLIDMDIDKFHLNKDSQKLLFNWIKDFSSAFKLITEYQRKANKNYNPETSDKTK